MANSNDNNNEVVTQIDSWYRIYKDSRCERLYDTIGLAYVPPSLDDPQTGVSSKDVKISPHVSARLYLPKITTDSSQKLPILVYYHGGALVLGSAFFNAYQRYLNILVAESNAIAISVEYRLAPEHDVPTIYEDCWTALQWVASHASEKFTSANEDPWLKNFGDFSRLSIIGDSAGGNIVYHMAMRAGREGGVNENVSINGSILVCPYLLVPLENIEQGISYKNWIIISPPSEAGLHSPMINPLAEKAPCLSGLACSRVLLCFAEKDEYIPREIGIEFVEGIKKSEWKGDLEFVEVEDEGHCFQLANPETEKSRDLIKRFASFIQLK
ncbi:2-hydroxyisoflavanone dehydratase-like [Lycium ferocissimum]|uniref:2-hydroxyisoflavanone dehydratase-like n=1 Tax=Lycium ferocissimum TaxID=112874 RepID=UPI00281589F8|nr:2-hydroxyisoflavanone dehydratase-like [Lycium ferocissimum]